MQLIVLFWGAEEKGGGEEGAVFVCASECTPPSHPAGEAQASTQRGTSSMECQVLPSEVEITEQFLPQPTGEDQPTCVRRRSAWICVLGKVSHLAPLKRALNDCKACNMRKEYDTALSAARHRRGQQFGVNVVGTCTWLNTTSLKAEGWLEQIEVAAEVKSDETGRE